MRIGIEAQRIFRVEKHGMDMVAVELIKALQQIDKDNEYFVFINKGPDKQIIQETANFKVIESCGMPYPIWEQFYLPNAVRKYKLDLLHCTSSTAPVFPIKTSLVLTLHDVIFLENLSLTKGTPYQILGNIYRRWNVQSIIGKCSSIMTVSETEKETISKVLPQIASKLKVVKNGYGKHFGVVEDQEVLAQIRLKYRLPDEFILFLGNTNPKKNVANVLASLAQLHREGIRIPLVMSDLDEGYLTQVLESIGAENYRKNIHLVGYVPNSSMVYLYNLAKIFLYPSLRESFGIPIIESMACGTPVLTSAVGPLQETGGEAAMYVNPLDIQDIASGIKELLTNTQLREDYIQKGLKHVENYAWIDSAKIQLAYYYEAISKE